MSEPLEPISRAAIPLVTEQEIICGNCAGDAESPRVTLLTTDNRCAGCGAETGYMTVAQFRALNPNERTNNDSDSYSLA